jgi:hypothetical protein
MKKTNKRKTARKEKLDPRLMGYRTVEEMKRDPAWIQFKWAMDHLGVTINMGGLIDPSLN